MKTDMIRMLTAFHEAGHAFSQRHFGRIIKEVAIYPAFDLALGDGVTVLDADVVQPYLSYNDIAVTILAGFAAERRCGADLLSWGYFWESEITRYGLDRCAVSRVLNRGVEDDVPDDELDRLVRREIERTDALIAEPAHWRAINALAVKILECNYMTGAKAMKLLDNIISEA